MKSAPRSCANCSSYDPGRGCWVWVNRSRPAGTPQAWPRPPAPDDCCKNHKTRLESDALDAAIYALWEPLLIKSRWAAERNKGRRDSEYGG
jgi:hypothetical protein